MAAIDEYPESPPTHNPDDLKRARNLAASIWTNGCRGPRFGECDPTCDYCKARDLFAWNFEMVRRDERARHQRR